MFSVKRVPAATIIIYTFTKYCVPDRLHEYSLQATILVVIRSSSIHNLIRLNLHLLSGV